MLLGTVIIKQRLELLLLNGDYDKAGDGIITSTVELLLLNDNYDMAGDGIIISMVSLLCGFKHLFAWWIRDQHKRELVLDADRFTAAAMNEVRDQRNEGSYEKP